MTDFQNIEEIDFKIKENRKQIDRYVELVSRIIDKEFELQAQNKALYQLKETLVKRKYNLH